MYRSTAVGVSLNEPEWSSRCASLRTEAPFGAEDEVEAARDVDELLAALDPLHSPHRHLLRAQDRQHPVESSASLPLV